MTFPFLLLADGLRCDGSSWSSHLGLQGNTLCVKIAKPLVGRYIIPELPA